MKNNIVPAAMNRRFTPVEIAAGLAMAFSFTDLIIDHSAGSGAESSWVIVADVCRIIGLILFAVIGALFYWMRSTAFQKVMMVGAVATYVPSAVLELLVHTAGMAHLAPVSAGLGTAGLFFLIPLLVTMFSTTRRSRSRR